jgi:hypothetical protein
MAIKLVQTVAPITSAGAASTQSTSITLKTGNIRIAPVGAAVAVAIGTNPTATTSDFAILEGDPEVLRERIAKQVISGITTGSTTTITFGENAGNPFLVGDFVSIVGASPAGINTSHNQVTGKTESSITISFDSSSTPGPITSVVGAYAARSVKVAALGLGGTATGVYISEVTDP